MTELATIDHDTGELLEPAVTRNLFGTSDPAGVLLEAKRHADVLANVIKERQLYRVIGQKAHVFVEAWTMLGSMLGVYPVSDGDPEPVEIDGVTGFRATVKVVTRDGAVVGRAAAYCMRDEPTWKNRPIHAVAAMAETRATSRALRKPLGFIVQLAGYSATAAEEMTDLGGPKPEVTNKSSNRKATKEQHAKLAKVIDDLTSRDPSKDWTFESRATAKEMFGVESRADLTVTQMHDLIEVMQTADVPI